VTRDDALAKAAEALSDAQARATTGDPKRASALVEVADGWTRLAVATGGGAA
jgi:hypothetical protein